MKKDKLITTVRISEEVKQQLFEMKGTASANEYISSMIYFCRIHSIDPLRPGGYNSSAPLLKGQEQIKKILKVFERDYLKPLMNDERLTPEESEEVVKLKNRIRQLEIQVRAQTEGPKNRTDKLEIIKNFAIKELDIKNFRKSQGTDFFVPEWFFKKFRDKIIELCS